MHKKKKQMNLVHCVRDTHFKTLKVPLPFTGELYINILLLLILSCLVGVRKVNKTLTPSTSKKILFTLKQTQIYPLIFLKKMLREHPPVYIVNIYLTQFFLIFNFILNCILNSLQPFLALPQRQGVYTHFKIL